MFHNAGNEGQKRDKTVEGLMLTLTDSLSCSLCTLFMAQCHGLIIVKTDYRGISLGIPQILRVVCTVRPFLLLF